MQSALPFILIIVAMVVRGRLIPDRNTVVIGRPPDGTFTERACLTGAGTTATLDFPPPYSGQSATLATAAGATATGFADPFTIMLDQVSARLAGPISIDEPYTPWKPGRVLVN